MAPRNMAGGEPAGGLGMAKRWKKKLRETTIKIRPSKNPARLEMSFIREW